MFPQKYLSALSVHSEATCTELVRFSAVAPDCSWSGVKAPGCLWRGALAPDWLWSGVVVFSMFFFEIILCVLNAQCNFLVLSAVNYFPYYFFVLSVFSVANYFSSTRLVAKIPALD